MEVHAASAGRSIIEGGIQGSEVGQSSFEDIGGGRGAQWRQLVLAKGAAVVHAVPFSTNHSDPWAEVRAACLVMVGECGTKRAMTARKRKAGARPLDQKALEEFALRYVSRYATTRSKLQSYLRRKLRERGWEGDVAADVDGLIERLRGLGYVDDRAYALAKASAHDARGLGSRRLAQTLRGAGITEDDQAPALEQAAGSALHSALRFARRRRFGPFASARVLDPRDRERALAAFARAGHSLDLAKRILASDPTPDFDFETVYDSLSHTVE
jgi:regulatory protein